MQVDGRRICSYSGPTLQQPPRGSMPDCTFFAIGQMNGCLTTGSGAAARAALTRNSWASEFLMNFQLLKRSLRFDELHINKPILYF